MIEDQNNRIQMNREQYRQKFEQLDLKQRQKMQNLSHYLVENANDPKDSINWEYKFIKEKEEQDQYMFQNS